MCSWVVVLTFLQEIGCMQVMGDLSCPCYKICTSKRISYALFYQWIVWQCNISSSIFELFWSIFLILVCQEKKNRNFFIFPKKESEINFNNTPCHFTQRIIFCHIFVHKSLLFNRLFVPWHYWKYIQLQELISEV